jgi:D-alanyl-lipoteichoic acid acyltransferase DltB (MBOAT superfamily)
LLFNTLAYAKFFACVFVVAWVLVSLRWALLLPWFALAGYAVAHPGGLALGLVLGSGALSLWLCRRSANARPGLGDAAISAVVNFGALAWLTYRSYRVDPLTLSLRALKVPHGASLIWTLAALAMTITAATWLLRVRKLRLIFLLGSSYVFYAFWDWRFLPLILGSSTADWLLGNAIARAPSESGRKRWLFGTALVNLGVLAVFKYFDFGMSSMRALLQTLGFHPPEATLRVVLPIGISFFTFESMSYVIDIYRRRIQPHPSYLEYLTFVAFFPHLVAGPIIRPRDLLPQLASPPRWSGREGSEGLFLIGLGLLKKVAIGDYLALNLVDRVFDAPMRYSALECYAAVVGYAVQIYCDFSGYTDIAIGSALLLGIRFPLNFNAPYKAQNIADFWRRWHISLSTWLRDYLYIPLGGNRKGRVRTYVNLMLTMLLGGLWHGANWTFVAWGGLHGAALLLTRAFGSWRERRGLVPSGSPVKKALSVFLTFHFVCAAWVFFRAESFGKARLFFFELATLTTYHVNLPRQLLAVLALGVVCHYLPERWYLGSRDAFIRWPAPAQGLALFCVALALHNMQTAEAVPFVYFQF